MPFPGRVQRGIRSHSQLWHRNAVQVHDHGLQAAQFDADAHYSEDASLAERRCGRDLYMTRSRRGPEICCDALVHGRRLQERGQQGHTTCIEDEPNCLLGTFGIFTVQELAGTPHHRVWALNTPEIVRPRYMAYLRERPLHDSSAQCSPRKRIHYRLDIGAPAPSRGTITVQRVEELYHVNEDSRTEIATEQGDFGELLVRAQFVSRCASS